MPHATSLGLLAALLTPWPQAGQAPQEQAPAELVQPGERRTIAGLAGLAITSTLKSTDAAGEAREDNLQLWFVFPQRVRWQAAPRNAKRGERVLHYRYGPQTWRVGKGEATSQRLEAAQALAVELELELRRALWLWPDGFPWSEGGERRTAAVAVPSLTAEEPWFLVARVGQEGRPIEMGLAAGSPAGEARVGPSLRSVTWKAQGDRHFPATLEFYRGAALQWSETVGATYRSPQALEHFFLPPDRKPADTPVGTSTPREVRLPARPERRQALEAGTTWEVALATAGELAATERARLEPTGVKLAPTLIIELDSEAAPRAVLLELQGTPEELPEGWTLRPESAAWDLRLPGQGPVPAARLAQLRSRLGSTDRPDWPFARISSDARGGSRLQLVLPFER